MEPKPTESGLGELAGQDPVRTWQKIDDPAADGWESEILAEQAKKQLGKLGAFILGGKVATAEDLAPFLAPGFSGSPLVPPAPLVVFKDAAVRVERAPGEAEGLEESADFLAAVQAVAREFSGTQATSAEVKVVEIAIEGEPAEGPPAFTPARCVFRENRAGSGGTSRHLGDALEPAREG